MRNNLMQFLFGDSVIRESGERLGEQVLKLFEEAADEETEEMVATKEPLATALKSLGVDTSVEAVSQACELTCDSPEQYREYVRILFDPANLHKLAEKGWVPAKMGDAAMSFEPAELKIGFIEIATAETGDKDKAPDLEKVLKDAQKFAATEPPHDDDMNPVEFDKKGSKDGQKGVGEPKDGEAPEGKPKGAKSTTEACYGGPRTCACPKCGCEATSKDRGEVGGFKCPKCKHAWSNRGSKTGIFPPKKGKSAKQVAESLLEMTSTGAVPAMDGGSPPVMGSGTDWKKRLKALRQRRGEKPTDDDRP